MKNNFIKSSILFFVLCCSFFSQAQVTASDEDTGPYTTCNPEGANVTRTSNDLTNPVNVGIIDDRSCYANYKESTINGTTWGIYNITDGSNNQDAANTLQPRIERSLSRSKETGVGSFAKFTGIVRILEVGDTTGTNNDGTYIMQAKGKHTGGGGSADPAICLYLAKPVLDTNGNQISFNIYREQINFRGGEGATGRSLVFLTNISKNVETTIELEVGFRQDPNDASKKIHYSDAVIGSQTFNFNIPEPERGLESGIRYGVYRVRGGRAQIRWANTTYQKEEIVDQGSTTDTSQSWEFKTSQNANGWVAGSSTLNAAIVADGLEVTWNANTKPKVRIPSGANINTTTNKILALTLINNSTEPIDWQVKYTRADNGNDKFFGNTNFDDTSASVTNSTTYYFNMTDAAWNGIVNEFEIQMRDTGNTNRNNASTTGSIIFQKIAFINQIPKIPITSVASGDWTSTSIWDGGVVPTSADDVIIKHAVRVKKNVTAAMASLTIESNPAQLRIDNESTVTVTGMVSIARNQDGIGLYAQTGPLGSFTYGSVDPGSIGKRVFVRTRLPKNDAWSLISSPVKDSRINEITGINSPNIVTKNDKFSIASYNDGKPAGAKYEYYSSASTLANSVQIEEGEGHILKVDNTGDSSKPDFTQRGVLRTIFPVAITISDAGNGFNLLGNPLTGYLNVNDAADGTNNMLRVNGQFGSDILAEDTIWLWDSVNESWATHNLGSSSYKMPGVQGFFVKAKAGGGSFSFTKAMQSGLGNTFLKSSSLDRFEVNLSVENESLQRSAAVIFTNSATTSFDNGYDSSIFGAYASKLEIYTNLIANNTGKKLAIQSLPKSNFDNMIVPVGVTAQANSEIVFSANALNIPKGYNVILEDRQNNMYTSLTDKKATYTAIVENRNTDGRFFLHVKASVLAANDHFLNSVSLFMTDNTTIRVLGLQNEKTTFQLFTILGEQILSTSFKSKSVNDISLPSLSSGVYIVQLTTEFGKLNKKIVLN
ncbi:T9SS type A sorting domain-containing protein [uncultured Polaribacter sp.]|uniref:T9SS type A sorting domain-containing protein n=1 Tax=uncultured Polaribacter sp. TaxID=174711 RepID=UPI00261ECB32|nr:T9SS type A sorting domain-containing protein [uncultured Polaribacter sp.]